MRATAQPASRVEAEGHDDGGVRVLDGLRGGWTYRRVGRCRLLTTRSSIPFHLQPWQYWEHWQLAGCSRRWGPAQLRLPPSQVIYYGKWHRGEARDSQDKGACVLSPTVRPPSSADKDVGIGVCRNVAEQVCWLRMICRTGLRSRECDDV